MSDKTTTLFSGIPVTVQFADGSTQEIKVRQLPIAEWESAVALIDDEIAITAKICGKPKSWITGTKPDGSDAVTSDSYAELQQAAEVANIRGFFSYAGRKLGREMVKANVNRMAGEQLSPTSSRTPPRPRA